MERLIKLRGQVINLKSYEVSPDALIPYAAVVPHQAEVIFRQRFEMTDQELENVLSPTMMGKTYFVRLRFTVILNICMFA